MGRLHNAKIFDSHGMTGTLALSNTTDTVTYDFFADKADKLEILDFIFKNTDLQVYDLDSPNGQDICEYKTVDEISSNFDLDNVANLQTRFNFGHQDIRANRYSEKLTLTPNVAMDTHFVIQQMVGDLYNCILAA